MTLIQYIASLVGARRRCLRSWVDGGSNEEHYRKMAKTHKDALEALGKVLPRGAGIDDGTEIDVDASTEEQVVLCTSYHHMDSCGRYDGWTEHRVTVRPSLVHGLRITISGPDRSGVKDYLGEVFEAVLTKEYMPDGTTHA
jgi:hypothetical protein